ncbi:MAG TPA: hypothetical protein VE978_00330 [Chitinophagales bacterium]|nr:hypothetical protein [Chitinophagales bacterium]
MKNEIEEFVNQSRIKSKRRKSRLKYFGKEKQLLDLVRELDRLRNEKNNLGFIELEKPMVKGWKRFFILRPDISSRKDKKVFQKILDKINTEVVCNRKDFRKRDYRRKRMEVIEQHTKWLTKKEFNELNFSDKERECFEYKFVQLEFGQRRRRFVYRFEWQFELKIKRNIITKMRVMNPVIEQRMSEIENYMERNNLWNKWSHIRGDGNYRSWDKGFREKEKYRFDKSGLTSA